jgi:hypothetical protein
LIPGMDRLIYVISGVGRSVSIYIMQELKIMQEPRLHFKSTLTPGGTSWGTGRFAYFLVQIDRLVA